MRILVTGAAGFIGWNLTRELRKRHPDATIVGVDNLWTGRRRREEFVTEMVTCYIEEYRDWSCLGKFEYVYHLASPASPDKYQSDPIRTISANLSGLTCCFTYHVSAGGTLLFASSSEVYGDPLVSPQPESYKGQVSCTGPRACYDESKRMGETICLEMLRAKAVARVKIARLFNVYGPGTLPDDGRCMSNFIWQAMRSQPLTIYGDGKQTRAFTYVDDVVRALVKLAEETGDFTGPVNIGIDQETSVQSLASAVMTEAARWMGQTGRGAGWRATPPAYMPAAVDDPRQRLPDLALAREILGWNPARLVQMWGDRGGIRRTIDHFESEYLNEIDHHDAEQAMGAEDTGGTA